MKATTQRVNTEASLPITLGKILWLKENVGPVQYEMATPTFWYGIASGRLWTFISVQYRALQSSSIFCLDQAHFICLPFKKQTLSRLDLCCFIKALKIIGGVQNSGQRSLGGGYIAVFNYCSVIFL